MLKSPSDSPFDGSNPHASPMRAQRLEEMRRTKCIGKATTDKGVDGEKRMSQAEQLLAKVRANSTPDSKKQSSLLQ